MKTNYLLRNKNIKGLLEKNNYTLEVTNHLPISFRGRKLHLPQEKEEFYEIYEEEIGMFPEFFQKYIDDWYDHELWLQDDSLTIYELYFETTHDKIVLYKREQEFYQETDENGQSSLVADPHNESYRFKVYDNIENFTKFDKLDNRAFFAWIHMVAVMLGYPKLVIQDTSPASPF